MKVLFLQNDEGTRFTVDMLNREHVDTQVWVGDPDEGVSNYKATHVVTEPSKAILPLHPDVKWIVRCKTPRGSYEYIQTDNATIATYSETVAQSIRTIIKAANPSWSYTKLNEKVVCLPNYYPYTLKTQGYTKKESEFVDVACFGDNQWHQALAAIQYAGIMGKTLKFHIRETLVSPDLVEMFKVVPHQLVTHPPMGNDSFLKLLSQMDMAMHVSSSETFNLVAASVVTGLPIVVSPKVTWATSWCQVEPTNCEEMIIKLIKANDWRLRVAMKVLNSRGLKSYCESCRSRWTHQFISE